MQFTMTAILHCVCMYMYVHYLFPSKDLLVEVELELLVGHVDAELLKRIGSNVLKAKDVQNTNIHYLCRAMEKL